MRCCGQQIVTRERTNTDDGIISSRIARLAASVVAGSSNDDHTFFNSIITSGFQRLGKVICTEAHIDNVRSIVYGVLYCLYDIAYRGISILRRNLYRHELYIGHDAGYACAVVGICNNHAGNESAMPVVIRYIRSAAYRIIRGYHFRWVDILVTFAVGSTVKSAVDNCDRNTVAELPFSPCSGDIHIFKIPLSAVYIQRIVH